MQVFTLSKDVEVLVCDLATYKNQPILKYSSTYYKDILTDIMARFREDVFILFTQTFQKRTLMTILKIFFGKLDWIFR